MSNVDRLINWKTDAWKDPQMVAWYSQRMLDRSGTLRLNNELETGLIARFCVGDEVLDVGIGTGRASLPLARAGKRVTGVDSSQAMLDETRRLADGVPITLIPGDVLKLPVADQAFDTLCALNVMTHFPHWREVLPHWASKVRDGGRLVFDVYSLDHLRLAKGQPLTEADMLPAPGDDGAVSRFNLRIRVDDLVEVADSLGLTIVDVVPYRGFFGSTDANQLLLPWLDGLQRWERFLSWLGCDPQLFALAQFLEANFIAPLTSNVSGKLMLVLDKRADPLANRRWKARNDALNALLLGDRISLDDLADYLPAPADSIRRDLAAHLTSLRNQMFCYRLVKPMLANTHRFDLHSLLPADILALFVDWFRRETLDQVATRIAGGWSACLDNAEATKYEGVDLAVATEYALTERLLTEHLGQFSGVRS